MLLSGLISQQSSSAPPVGRTIPISLTAGDNIIDGNDLPYEGGTTTLQNGDTVVISGRVMTGYLSIENFNLPNGQHATIKNAGLIDMGTNQLWLGDGDSQETAQPMRNITIDFYNQDGVNEYGLKINTLNGGSPSRIFLNSWDAPHTWENVTIRGIEADSDWQPMAVMRWGGNGILYNNGSGTISSKNLTIDKIKINILSQAYGSLLEFSSSTDGNGADDNYHEDLTISNVEFNGDGTSSTTQLIHVSNTKNYTIRDISFNNLFKGTEHTRLVVLYGYGKIYNIRGINHYGNIFQLIPFKRSSDLSAADVKFHNILGYNNKKYALVEVSGIGNQGVWDATWCTPVSVQGDFCTAHTLGNGDPSWKAGIIDVFGTLGGETVIVNNSVVQNANDLTTSVGAPGDNNYVHPTVETISPDLDTITFEPASGSPIIGAATSTPAWALLDINGNPRPPVGATLGACEPE